MRRQAQHCSLSDGTKRSQHGDRKATTTARFHIERKLLQLGCLFSKFIRDV
jgi:hypothetical protein